METPEARVVGGYRNEDEKRAYLLRAGVIGAACLVAQIFAPMLFPMVAMPFMMSGGMEFTTDDASSATRWEDGVVFVQRVDSTKKERAAYLRTMSASGAIDARRIPLADRTGTLTKGGGKLWYVARRQVQIFDDPLSSPTTAQGLEEGGGAVFYADGALRAASNAPDGVRFKTLRDGVWEDWFRLPTGGNSASVGDVVASGGFLHLFAKTPAGLYHAVVQISSPGSSKLEWGEVRGGCSAWTAYEENGTPAVACVTRDQGMSGRIDLMRPAAAGWIVDRTFPLDVFLDDMSVLPAEPGRGRLLVSSGFPRSMILYAADGEALVERARIGSAFPFPAPLFAIMMVPYFALIVLSFVLAGLLDRHIASYRSSTDGPEHSPLLRRAFAQVVDMMVLGAPVIAGGIFFFRMVTRGLGPKQMMIPFLLMGGQFLWMFAGLLAFSYAEGVWGATPGKKLLGLRVVGIDGEPCGFGRALIRNVLKLADGFFNFNVGLLLAALTDTRQRLGDMAARTVVIRVRR